MPYEIRRGVGGCEGHAVRKVGDERVLGCHESREKALRQTAALYAVEERDKD